ncbi:DNA-3-methyladenine glycosylase [Acinetobacter sp. AOR15_HL]|uniref:DNA-3-methyladenine glycosylase n=1 Tax=unclassified Acinetobacter TaxID=196816 RepID=UPI0022EB3ACA|nr:MULTISPECIES: DNA-3-methyladenine glycosylase [unclassified Acinetobacter]MDA3557202.1 DNA-3-methyladenine glycosylase [Acinetobacter sp. AOR15_HL]MDA3572811.1 DNA-3-methyladenine glycosylase [Acinetobacter sp. AOR14_HL]
MSDILPLSWFQRETSQVAHDLIGCVLCRRKADGHVIRCTITETEAYLGIRDKACHSYNDKRTARTDVMYGSGGTIYVYLIYGMYEMLNLITQTEGIPEGVMIRSAFLNGASTKKEYKLLAGPGKLTRYLGIDRSLKGQTLGEESGLWIESASTQPEVVMTPRIGIDYAEEAKEWLERYCWKDHLSLSR